MDFSEVLEYLKDGGKVRREKWARNGLFLKIDIVDNKEIIYKYNGDNKCKWVVAQHDILAKDWDICEEEYVSLQTLTKILKTQYIPNCLPDDFRREYHETIQS